jgi:hypothetical protein
VSGLMEYDPIINGPINPFHLGQVHKHPFNLLVYFQFF